MDKILLYPVGASDSCSYAAACLEQNRIALTDHPSPEITHLLLDIPSFDAGGVPRNGLDLIELLRMLPDAITVIGGNLNESCLDGFRKMDLLRDPYYLAKNAAITADCAVKVCAPYLKTTFEDSAVFILGWGRIGKCLARLLSVMGCSVTVAARKESDRAMLQALGYGAVDFSQIPQIAERSTILFNTVPNLPLHSDEFRLQKNSIVIDLASYPGMRGNRVIPAKGLPGKYAPESSGRLIAETILRLCKEET